MNLAATLEDIKQLSVDERIQLAQAIWDTIDEESIPGELTEGQKADLSRRMKELDENPSIGLTWDEIKARRRNRR